MTAAPAAPVLEAIGVTRRFPRRLGRFRAGPDLVAVDAVSLAVQPGETFALVGSSGSGKTTLAMLLLGLDTPSAGTVRLDGTSIAALTRRARARRIQPVFQDPTLSLNPRRAVADIIAEPLAVHGIGDRASRAEQVRAMMEATGLPSRLARARPAELSGGQRQRVAIARALVLGAGILVCDEPTSALDVSVQAQILNLLQDLRAQFGLTILLVTHDLAVVRHLAHRVGVMHRGVLVEQAETAALFAAPAHPATRRLLAATLTLDPEAGLPDIDDASAA